MVLRDPETSGELLLAMGESDALVARVGEEGVTLTVLRPVGRVELDGRIVDATAEGGYIDADRPVRVVEVTAFGILVAKHEETA